MNVPRIALYEFMPYGAPELLEDSPRSLTRAMTAAMTLFAALYLALMGLMPFLAHAPLEVPVGDVVIFHLEPPPPLTEARPMSKVLPGDPHIASVPLPVPDQAAPPDATIYSQEQIAQIGQGPDIAPSGEGPVALPRVVDTYPDPDSFVWVEEYPAVATTVRPLYPDLAREAGVEGQVVVQALVGIDGRVKKTRVVKSVPLLDEAAVDAVRSWVFTPALNNKRPVAVWVRVPVVFTLH